MRKLIVGTVNGKSFTLYEDGKVDCEDSELGRLVSDWASFATKQAKQEIMDGSTYYRLVWIVVHKLEYCKEAEIKVKKAFDYENETTLVFYYNTPLNKSISRRLFLKGRLKNGIKFKVQQDYQTTVRDATGQRNMKEAELKLEYTLRYIVTRDKRDLETCSWGYNEEYAVYEELKSEKSAMIIERACFYEDDDPLGRVY